MAEEVIDLCDSDAARSPEPLATRLQRRAEPQGAGQHGDEAAGRAPLLALHNRGGSGGSGGSPRKAADPPLLLPRPAAAAAATAGVKAGGAEALQRRRQERAARKAREAAEAAAAEAAAAAAVPAAEDSLGAGGFDSQAAFGTQPRTQYHQQEQQQQQQEGYEEFASPASTLGAPPRAPGSSARRRGPTRGARLPTAALPTSPLLGGLDTGDDEWQPGASQRAGGRAGAAAAGGEQAPPAKKARRPKRTAEEIARDKAQQVRDREDRKRLKQLDSKKYALQAVRVLLDAGLMASGGGGAVGGGGRGGGRAGSGQSLGVRLLGALDDYNSRLSEATAAERRINYQVASLDLAPYHAIRWQRKRLVSAGAGASQQAALGSQASTAAEPLASQLEEQWELAPHVMVFFQPQEFIDAVLRDRLASLFALLERRAPGQRPYLLVCGLARHVRQLDVQRQQADVRAGVTAQQHELRPDMEQFIAELAVECPRLSFRDVLDPAQAAQHVQLLTAAIAKQPHADSDATVFLRAHNSDTTSMNNLLINCPLEDRALEPLARCLAAVPTVKPGVAHTLATYYGSLAGLMDTLLHPGRSDRDKEAEIRDMQRAGSSISMRVGPAAARQLLALLRSDDPGLRIKAGGEGEGADG